MEMEKSFEVNPELEEMREQFRMLTEKVEKQNIVTEQLMREVSKKKIQRFEFWAYWIFYVISIIAEIWGIVMFNLEGYPLWTYFIFFYLFLVLFILTIRRYKRNRRYFSRINYDITTYLKDEESSLQRKFNVKAACIVNLILAPAYIHFAFLINYLISVNEVYGLGEQWWSYAIVFFLAIFLGVTLGDKYRRMIYKYIFD